MDDLVADKFYWIVLFDELTVAQFQINEYGERYLLRIGVDTYGAVGEDSPEWERGCCRIVKEARPPKLPKPKPNPSYHEKTDRNRALAADRAAGMTYSQLSKKYGVGVSRAVGIVDRERRLENRVKPPDASPQPPPQSHAERTGS